MKPKRPEHAAKEADEVPRARKHFDRHGHSHRVAGWASWRNLNGGGNSSANNREVAIPNTGA